MADKQNLMIISREFGVLPVMNMDANVVRKLILSSIKNSGGLTEKSYLNLTRDAKKFVFHNTEFFSVSRFDQRVSRIKENSGDCYGVAFQKANHGCANCLSKKECKKIVLASGNIIEKKPEVEKKVTKSQLEVRSSGVSFVASSKIHRSLRHQFGDKIFPKESWVLLRDASGRERPIPHTAIELAEQLESLGESIDKKSTFMQVLSVLKKHKLYSKE